MMGAAKYMVTIRFATDLYPTCYFFHEAPLANRFYYNKRETYAESDLFAGSQVKLWRLSDDGQHWDLKLSSDNA